MIKGKNVYMSAITLDDAMSFRNHKEHEDQRLRYYNFKNMTRKDVERWYKEKISLRHTYYYTINVGRDRIGFISLKNVNTRFKSASFGISIGADYTEKGYGRDAMETMIDYYRKLGIKKFYLRVHTDNVRALNLYKSLGFEKIFTWYTTLPKEILPFVERKDRINILGINLYRYYLMKKVVL